MQGCSDIITTLALTIRIICPLNFTRMRLSRSQVLTGWTGRKAQVPLLLTAVQVQETGRQMRMNTESLNAAE